MSVFRTRTYLPKVSEIKEKWHLVDAKGEVLGRLASRVAMILRGKHRPDFTPHMDLGDHVVVINAGEMVLKGRKLAQKKYYRHSGYPGGIRELGYDRMMSETPDRVLMLAVRRMLPRNTLGRKLLTKLRVYAGSEHHQAAQRPEPIDLCKIR
jgi:large subunit ribosomal protein L13